MSPTTNKRRQKPPPTCGVAVARDVEERSRAWGKRLAALIAAVTRRSKDDGVYAHANRDSVTRATSGRDPFGDAIHASAGAHMVVNLSSAHVPAFCASSGRDASPYKNCYDLARSGGRRVSQDRMLVDESLPVADFRSVYFGAAEINGAGIRFYGDVCLVLREIDPHTVVLDRNSFELLRSPISDQFRELSGVASRTVRQQIVDTWQGRWQVDLATLASIKVLRSVVSRDRRWTLGQISRSVRDDEDYIEVLKAGSFSTGDLLEARIAVADAAHDAFVGGRLTRGPMPRMEAMIWRNRRSRAERALRDCGVAVRVVTTAGRARD